MGGEVCAACSAAGSDLLQCSRCRAVSYCGPACQRRHWRTHKAHCSVVWRVEAVPGKGLGLVAARDIQPGQVILTEKPLLLLRKDKTDNKVEYKTKYSPNFTFCSHSHCRENSCWTSSAG